VETVAVGNVSVKAQSNHNTSATDEKLIVVIPKKEGISMGIKKRIVNFTG
jgi:hypothetical protein